MLSGPAGAMASLAAALEAAQPEDLKRQDDGEGPNAEARQDQAPLRAAQEPEVLLVIEVVEEVAAGEGQP